MLRPQVIFAVASFQKKLVEKNAELAQLLVSKALSEHNLTPQLIEEYLVRLKEQKDLFVAQTIRQLINNVIQPMNRQ